tara:strand:+ start:1132 stop:2352 length:1221 start_codon:yes stop_codon:yes gene_type:complete
MTVNKNRRKFLIQSKRFATVGVATLLGGTVVWRAHEREVFSESKASGEHYLNVAKSTFGEDACFFCAAGALASSYLNSQPWSFEVSDKQILVFADMSRWTGANDPAARMLFMSIGAAIRNIEIAARAHGNVTKTSIVLDESVFIPGNAELVLVAQIDLFPKQLTQDFGNSYKAIADRRTNRHTHDLGRYIAKSDIRKIRIIGETTLTKTLLIPHTERSHGVLARLMAEASLFRRSSRECTDDAARWFRCEAVDALAKRDGETLETLGIPPLYLPAWKFWRCPSPQDLANFRSDIIAERSRYSNYLGALMLPRDKVSMRSIVFAGGVWQSLCLTATQFGLSIHPVSALSEYFFTPSLKKARHAEDQFQRHVSRTRDWRAVLSFRLGRATGESSFSYRRKPNSFIFKV